MYVENMKNILLEKRNNFIIFLNYKMQNFEYTEDELNNFTLSELQKILNDYKLRISGSKNKQIIIDKILNYQDSLAKIKTSTGKFDNLPTDILTILVQYLPVCQIIHLCRLNKRLNNNICKNKIILRNLGHTYLTEHDERLPGNILKNIYQSRDVKMAAKKGYEKILYRVPNLDRNIADIFDPFPEPLKNYILQEAITNGYLDLVKYALENGASARFLDTKEAVRNGKNDVVKYLIDLYPDLVLAASNYAALYNNREILDYILSSLPEDERVRYIDKGGLVADAAEGGHLDLIKYLESLGARLRNKRGTILEAAIKSKNMEVIKYLIDRGANVHADDNNLLLAAAESGNLDFFKYLEDIGEDFIDVPGLLPKAVQSGNLALVKYLVSLGADIHDDECDLFDLCAHDIDNLSLAVAKNGKHYDIIKYLLSIGDYPKDIRKKYKKYLVKKGINKK